MTTAVRGTASRIRWQTSGPSAPSRRTSSKTTSGRLSPTMRIASSPVRASPTTAMSGSSSRDSRRPWRTTSWSSTTTIRIFDTVTTSLSIEGQRELSSDGDPGPRSPDDLEPAAGRLDAFTHLPEPEVPVPGSRRFRHAGGQADTVVGDADRGLVATDLDTDGRTSSARVFRDVDERLLQRLLEQVTSGRRQTRRVAAEVQLGRDPGELAEVLHEPLQPLGEGCLRQPLRREVTDELTDLGHHEAGVAADVLELRAQRRRRGDSVKAPVELETDRKGELAERVVQLVRDADPLVDAGRLGHLGVEAGVLERDGGVARRRSEDFDLFAREHPPHTVADREDADRSLVVEEGHREHGPDRHLDGPERLGSRRRHSRIGEEV